MCVICGMWYVVWYGVVLKIMSADPPTKLWHSTSFVVSALSDHDFSAYFCWISLVKPITTDNCMTFCGMENWMCFVRIRPSVYQLWIVVVWLCAFLVFVDQYFCAHFAAQTPIIIIYMYCGEEIVSADPPFAICIVVLFGKILCLPSIAFCASSLFYKESHFWWRLQIP